jgi:hypothetical protein
MVDTIEAEMDGELFLMIRGVRSVTVASAMVSVGPVVTRGGSNGIWDTAE